MKQAELEAQLRAGEIFHDLRVPPGKWAILRVDGRAFSKLTARKFQKPFDSRFHELMCEAALALFRDLGGLFGTTHSDEISVLLPRDFSIWSREVEKLVSVAAGVVSAQFSASFGAPAHFDARIWVGQNEAEVVDYFRWRQSDGIRCALNGAVYYALRAQNFPAPRATSYLKGLHQAEKLRFLRGENAAFDELPLWAQRGVGLVNRTVEKTGFNPQRGESVTVSRRIAQIVDLPTGEEFGEWLQSEIAVGNGLAP